MLCIPKKKNPHIPVNTNSRAADTRQCAATRPDLVTEAVVTLSMMERLPRPITLDTAQGSPASIVLMAAVRLFVVFFSGVRRGFKSHSYYIAL